jgi:sirohydrochlorin cobaltochelatase
MEELKSCGTKKVSLMPFLLVAGGHAEKDIASDDPASWKTILVKEGFEASIQNCGMGDSQEIVSIFLGHTKKALERLKIK